MSPFVYHHREIDPREALPGLAGIFDAADALAVPVCWGTISRDEAFDLLRFAPRVRAAPDDLKSVVQSRLAWALDDAIGRCGISRDVAYEGMRHALAPLLDRRAPDSELRNSAVENGQTLFAPSELRQIIATESAWWVRLHAMIAEPANAG